jgi:hypothetical protein
VRRILRSMIASFFFAVAAEFGARRSRHRRRE